LDILALITARGGSKGIPRKNLQIVGGKPLIAWTIESALASRCVSRVILSTDDEEIAGVGKTFGAEVPFLRPAALAGDTAPHAAVVDHAIDWLQDNEGRCPDFILLLQPTSPLRTAEDIRAAVQIAGEKNPPAVVSVSEMHPHPSLATRLSAEGLLLDYSAPGSGYVRRQDLQPNYAVNGALYLVQRDLFQQGHSLVPAGSYGYVMPPERSLDIDTEWDLRLAELILCYGVDSIPAGIASR